MPSTTRRSVSTACWAGPMNGRCSHFARRTRPDAASKSWRKIFSRFRALVIEPSAYAYTEVLAEKVYEYVWDQSAGGSFAA